ncbi:MAG: FTR1 family protein, partial [Gemmatimonadota bacterium]
MGGAGAVAAQERPGRSAERDPAELAALLTLAGDEYALGVSAQGRVVNEVEYEETRLFLAAVEEALPGLGGGAGAGARADLAAQVDSAQAVVERVGPPAELSRWLGGAVALLSREWGARLVEWPGRDPSPLRGRQVYGEQCASCHGPAGRGDGPLARELDPAPPDLTDRALLEAAPARSFQVISYGIRGTAMAGFRDRLSAEERWDLVAFIRTLAGDSVSVAAYVRGRGVEFARIRALVSGAVAKGLAGEGDAAVEDARRAYLEFERAEAALRGRDASLTASLERDFFALRGWVRDRPEDARGLAARLDSKLGRAERALAAEPGRASGAFESLTILVREGFEAMLIVGALLTFLTKLGHVERRRAVVGGVLAAIVASAVTAVAIEAVFHWGPASREALEGTTMLLATAVLFSVSYWLVSKIEHAAWDRYIRGKVRAALDRGSDFALASV